MLADSSLSRKTRLLALDGVRGIAILAVLGYHCYAMLPKHGDSVLLRALDRICAMGWMGVDLFFVLSGFLITRILLSERDSPFFFGAFYLRRAARILPLYATWLCGYVFVKYLTRVPATPDGLQLVYDGVPDWTHMLFVQNFYMVKHQTFGNGWLGVSWSLAVEEQFYLLFPLVVRFFRPKALLGLLILSIPVAFGLRSALLASDPSIRASLAAIVLLPCRMDALSSGAIVAWIFHYRASFIQASPIPSRIALALLASGIGLIVLHNVGLLVPRNAFGYSAYFVWTLMAACGLVWIAIDPHLRVIQGVLSNRILRFFGDTSYFLYLFHRPILAVTGIAICGRHPEWLTSTGTLTMLAAIGFLLVSAWLSKRFFEQPITRATARVIRARVDSTPKLASVVRETAPQQVGSQI